jgi:hypothetical protein
VVFAALCALTGEAPVRYHGFVYRDEDPRRFWRLVVMYFLASLFLFLIGLYLCLTSKLRHYPKIGKAIASSSSILAGLSAIGKFRLMRAAALRKILC